jgi:transcriptional regulator with XRE-family HTH domain|nr:MAG TPA: Repressor protein CI [Caudoviricetes sp.]
MNRLRQVRLSKGMNQQELAEALHASQAAISGWETGKYDPGMKNWKAIAALFGVPVDYLIDDSAEEKKETPSGIPDEVMSAAEAFMSLPPEARKEARAYLDYLKQRYTKQTD